jgi:hypothetical protein
MRIVYRTMSAPSLGKAVVTALRIAHDQGITGVQLGPKSIPRLLESGLVLDGAPAKVNALDQKLQAALRAQKIPFVRRAVSVIRKDTGPATMASAPPEATS